MWYGETECGNIIQLKKECGCIIHNEPHWIHMDRLIHKRNKQHLDNAKNKHSLRAVALLETERLKEKEYQFKTRKLVRMFEQ
ncbi:MAG: hypothetical protein H8D45_20800 [Bacteroidetes bacterium]|nr:hypothetical protein [Bacteroidota bacterium]